MGPVVDTPLGKLEGLDQEGIAAFLGMRFATPPVGALRFAAPQPLLPWTGVRPAVRFGPAAPQARGPMSNLPGFAVDEMGEDCLTLNVWTPKTDGGGRPVMVWVPGGGFAMGSGSQAIYDGAALARRGDLVVVTLNYRLGAMGFLYPTGLDAPGLDLSANAGLLDQVAVLEWVRDNISSFGGDPGNVTVFGESAGGMSVGSLLAMPLARGLFHRAIAQSGAENAWSPDEAAGVTSSLLSSLGIDSSDAGRLGTVPLEDLLAAQQECSTEYMRRRKGLAWKPVVDGKVIPAPPCQAVAEGSSADVPLLVGTNADEWRLFGLGDPGAFTLDDKKLEARLDQVIGAGYRDILVAYRQTRPDATPTDLWFAIESDRNFRIPATRLAAAHGRHSSGTYCYLFTWPSPVTGLGSCHGLEIPFVFGNLDKPGMPVFAGSTDEAVRLSELMQDAWVAFARTGNPSHPGLEDWPRYDAERRRTMLLGERCEVVDAPSDDERRVWELATVR